MNRNRTELRFGRRWRCAFALTTLWGWMAGGQAWSSDPIPVRDGPGTNAGRAVVRDPESDEVFQSLGVTVEKPGSSVTATRKQAVAELPLDQLAPNNRAKADSILKNLGLFRRLPTLTFEADPDVYEYFLMHPDVAVSTWRAMEISKFQLKETGPNVYEADAGDGSSGQVELIHHTANDTVILCDGAFKSPLMPKPIVARSLMRLQTQFTKDAEGRPVGKHSADIFVEFPSQAIETIAKATSPVSHTIADRNFKQMTLFVHLMSQAMARHPGWIESVGNKLDGVTAKDKQAFLELSARAHVRARMRANVATGNGANPTRNIDPDDVISPFRQASATAPMPFGAVIPVSTNSPPGTTPSRR